jgi:ferredoxin
MKVRVDKDKCVGGGQCVMMCAEVFDQGDEDGLVILLQESPDESLHDGVRAAVLACPASAIEFD